MPPAAKSAASKKAPLPVRSKPLVNKARNAPGFKSSSDDLARYYLALTDPFHPDALGAQVPDMFSYPTATFHAEGTIGIDTNAAGIASVLINPHPYLTAVDMTTTSVGSTSMTRYSTNSTYAATPIASMKATLSNFRVVGLGIEIRNLLPPTTATGRVIVATVPVSGIAPGPNSLLNTGPNNNTLLNIITGETSAVTSVTTGITSAILALPGALEYTVQDLITNKLSVQCRPCTPQAFEFRNALNETALTASRTMGQNETYITSTGVIDTTATDTIGTSDSRGFDAILLRFEGLPVSTTGSMEVKYILHYEGTPFVGSVPGMVATAPRKAVVHPVGLNEILGKVFTARNIQIGSGIVGAGMGGYSKGGPMGALTSMAAKLGLQL